jgi:hypothetical protein
MSGPAKKQRKPARPPVRLTPEIQAEVLHRLSEGESLRAICAGDDMPDASAVVLLCERDALFAQQYAHARNKGLDAIAEQALLIADDTTEDANSRRVRLDARKWFLSKLRPDKYGDVSALQLSGPGGAPIEQRTEIAIKLVRPTEAKGGGES